MDVHVAGKLREINESEKIKIDVSEEKKGSKNIKEIYDKNKIRKAFVKITKKIITLKKSIEIISENSVSENKEKMAEEITLNIQVFDGNDYSIWKKKIISIK